MFFGDTVFSTSEARRKNHPAAGGGLWGEAPGKSLDLRPSMGSKHCFLCCFPTASIAFSVAFQLRERVQITILILYKQSLSL